MSDPQFSYKNQEASCTFCSRTRNPHPEFDEPIVTTILRYNGKRIEICINCYFELKQLSEIKKKPVTVMLQEKLNLTQIFNKRISAD